MATEVIQNVLEIIDMAHTHRYELAEVLDEIKLLENQIHSSSDGAIHQLEEHFSMIKNAVVTSIDERLAELKADIEELRNTAVKPLEECKTLVNENVASTIQVMDEGAALLKDNPEENLGNLMKFKDNPKIKSLSSVPALPSPAEVACVNVVINPELKAQMENAVIMEGKVVAQAPVQISEVVAKPGGVNVQWLETDEDTDICEFWLQYAVGNHRQHNNSTAIFHTAYVGTCNSHLVKHLRTDTSYTFRVCGRGESDTPWSVWSVPRVASTYIPHYQWSPCDTSVYCVSNEGRIATRTREGVTHVLYSSCASFTPGNPLTIKVIEEADRSPGDGFAISLHNTDDYTFSSDGVVYINLYGTVFVDGQEITTKLPEIKKGSIVAFQTELLPNGKVIVSVENDEKEVTFDWKLKMNTATSELGMLGVPQNKELSLYFGIKFSQEHWKISVD